MNYFIILHSTSFQIFGSLMVAELLHIFLVPKKELIYFKYSGDRFFPPNLSVHFLQLILIIRKRVEPLTHFKVFLNRKGQFYYISFIFVRKLIALILRFLKIN